MDYDAEGDGAAGGTRTPDPRITNALLYQLSYCGPHRGAGRGETSAGLRSTMNERPAGAAGAGF